MFSTLGLFPALVLLCGCSALDNCPDDAEHAIVIDSGSTDRDALVYSSAPWEGPRDHFPANTCLRFVHDLGATPELVTSYVSFESEGSDVSENAGNQGRIKCVDDHEIVIRNDTCEDDFYIIVSAFASGSKHAETSCADRHIDGCSIAE